MMANWQFLKLIAVILFLLSDNNNYSNAASTDDNMAICSYEHGEVNLQELLGSGTTSYVFKAEINHQVVALKIFKNLRHYSDALNSDLEIFKRFEELAIPARYRRHLATLSPGFPQPFSFKLSPIFFQHKLESAGIYRPQEAARNADIKLSDSPSSDITLRSFVMPCYSGTLLDIFNIFSFPSNAFADSRLTTLAREIASAIFALHNMGLVHADIKPKNIFLQASDTSYHAVLGDFGCMALNTEPLGARGTPGYMAPEIAALNDASDSSIDALNFFHSSIDIFAFGSTLFEMLHQREVVAEELISEQQRYWREPSTWLADTSAPVLRDIIKRCWSLNPEDRPRIRHIIKELDAL